MYDHERSEKRVPGREDSGGRHHLRGDRGRVDLRVELPPPSCVRNTAYNQTEVRPPATAEITELPPAVETTEGALL